MMKHANDAALLVDAAAFAAAKHRNQRRKDAEASPYINHPLELARILAVDGDVADAQTIAAALLHDTIEDTQTTFEELKERFGKVVADIVAEVTDNKALSNAERKHLQEVHAPHLTTRAKLVKLADKIANVRDVADNPPADWSLARRQEYFDWAARVVAGLRGTNAQLETAFDAAMAGRPDALPAR